MRRLGWLALSLLACAEARPRPPAIGSECAWWWDCPAGLRCFAEGGLGGPTGRRTCELPCDLKQKGSDCPAGYACVMINDGRADGHLTCQRWPPP